MEDLRQSNEEVIMPSFRKIALLKEVEGPENPGAFEKRVALTPKEVNTLVKTGCKVFVEEGAGAGVGYNDLEYLEAGAEIQTHEQIYSGKDLLIKFKNVSYECIPRIDKGATLFCMAHNASFPVRAQKLLDRNVNVDSFKRESSSANFSAHKTLSIL